MSNRESAAQKCGSAIQAATFPLVGGMLRADDAIDGAMTVAGEQRRRVICAIPPTTATLGRGCRKYGVLGAKDEGAPAIYIVQNGYPVTCDQYWSQDPPNSDRFIVWQGWFT